MLEIQNTEPFELERAIAEPVMAQEKLTLGVLGATAIACLSLPFFVHTERIVTGLLLGGGTVSAGLFGVVAQIIEKKKPLYDSLEKADDNSLKEKYKGRAVVDHIVTSIESKRRAAAYVNSLPLQERVRFAQEFGLQGLVTLPQPPAQPQPETPIWLSGELATSVETVERKPVTPSMDWIIKLVANMAEEDPEKRRNHHLVINGPTQYGKSTLCSCILILLSQALAHKGMGMSLNLIDPKYPLSKWFVEPSYKGYEEVLEGVTAIAQEIEDRKKQVTKARQSKQPLPRLNYYVAVTDEWDNIWSGGKGYGKVITEKQAVEIRNAEQSAFKEGAALNVVNVIMGQSPLRDDHGFTQSTLNSATRIVLGIEALKWLNSNQFPYNDMKEQLSAQLDFWTKQGHRVALIVPNNATPFVAPVPREVKLVVGQYSTTESVSVEEKSGQEDWYEAIRQWHNALGRRPIPAELKTEWQRLTGQELNDKGVLLLLEHLGYKD